MKIKLLSGENLTPFNIVPGEGNGAEARDTASQFQMPQYSEDPSTGFEVEQYTEAPTEYAPGSGWGDAENAVPVVDNTPKSEYATGWSDIEETPNVETVNENVPTEQPTGILDSPPRWDPRTTESEFNRSSEMQEQYGSYDNFVAAWSDYAAAHNNGGAGEETPTGETPAGGETPVGETPPGGETPATGTGSSTGGTSKTFDGTTHDEYIDKMKSIYSPKRAKEGELEASGAAGIKSNYVTAIKGSIDGYINSISTQTRNFIDNYLVEGGVGLEGTALAGAIKELMTNLKIEVDGYTSNLKTAEKAIIDGINKKFDALDEELAGSINSNAQNLAEYTNPAGGGPGGDGPELLEK